MEEFLAAKTVFIKVCDSGSRFKIKDISEKDILVAQYLHSDPCGCCPSDSEDRFRIHDSQNKFLYALKSVPVDDCCGCSSQMEAKVVRAGGAELGEIGGVPNEYVVKNASGDRLYNLSSGMLSNSYKIIPSYSPTNEGKVSKEFTFLNLVSRLQFPECCHEMSDHKVLLLVAALEITHRYYLDQQRS